MMYTAFTLTHGERLFIVRRRLGLTIPQMAKRYQVSAWRYQQWELGVPTGEPQAPTITHLRELTPGECCTLARRRAQMSIHELGTLMGLSHVTIIKWESAKDHAATAAIAPYNPVAAWWQQRGWPKIPSRLTV